MKSFTTISLSLFLLLNVQLQAQTNSEIELKAATVVQKLDAAFKLEKDQKNNIQNIFIDFFTAQEKIKDNIQGPASGLAQGFARQDFQSTRKKNEALIISRDNKLKKELTEEQFKKWKGSIEPSLHPHRSNKR